MKPILLVVASTVVAISLSVVGTSNACDKSVDAGKPAKTADATKPAPAKPAPAPAPPAPVVVAAPTPIAIEVTSQGFSTNKITVKKGVPVTFAFTRTSDKTCAKEVVIAVGDGTTIERALPLKQKVEIAMTFAKSGELSYACKMDMVTGTIYVQ
jgi:plastocyanin